MLFADQRLDTVKYCAFFSFCLPKSVIRSAQTGAIDSMRRVTAVAWNSLRAYRVGDGLQIWGSCCGRRAMISAGNRLM